MERKQQSEARRIERQAMDSISILESSKGDGVMDKKAVFFQGLELVTGFCLWKDGVIAVANPDIVFIRDTDADGKADKVERMFTGFAPGDTHFVVNHLIAAPDGWIHADSGGTVQVKSPDGKEIVRITSGLFRFKPDGSAIEQVSAKGGNGFGADISSSMEMFFGQATTGNPFQHVVLPEWVLNKGKLGQSGSANAPYSGRKVVREKMTDRAIDAD